MNKDRPKSPFAYSTASSASFNVIGDNLISSLDGDLYVTHLGRTFRSSNKKLSELELKSLQPRTDMMPSLTKVW